MLNTVVKYIAAQCCFSVEAEITSIFQPIRISILCQSVKWKLSTCITLDHLFKIYQAFPNLRTDL